MKSYVRNALLILILVFWILATLVYGSPVHNFSCESCHKASVVPTELGNATTQVCLSCHNDLIAVTDASNARGSYPAGVTPGRQTSHMWAAAESNPAAGASPPSDRQFYSSNGTSNGKVTCSRCHDPHGATTNPQLLRLGAGSSEALCRDCHRAWALQTANHGRETHPLVANYANSVVDNPGKYFIQPGTGGANGGIRLVNGGVACTSCHGAHFADSSSATVDGPGLAQQTGDGYLLRADGASAGNPSALCQSCHTYLPHGDNSGEKVGCLGCHSGHSYNGGTPNYYVLRDRVTTATFQTATGLAYSDPAVLDAQRKSSFWNDGIDGSANGYCEKCHGDAGAIPGHSRNDVCAQCHQHAGPNASYSFAGTGCTGCHLGTGDLDDTQYGNGVLARIDQTQWQTKGHGATAATDCAYCHGAAGHGDAANPYQLIGLTGSLGANGVCWNCHLTDSAGVDPDGSGPLTRVNAGKKVDSRHHGAKHGTVNNGGRFCWDCHDPHGDANLAMVHAQVSKQTDGVFGLPTQSVPVVFTAKGTGTDFARSSAPYNGICNVCHSGTGHYRSNFGDGHNASVSCVACHQHSNEEPDLAFAASGSCTGCHSSPQDNGDNLPPGGRRAATNEFPVNVAHAHYGLKLDDASCQVCHSTVTHMNGVVELIDADTGALYSFAKPENLPASRDLSEFCNSCHDANGATRLATPLDPFGGGNRPPDVASKFKGSLRWNVWYGDNCFGFEGTMRPANSHHDVSGADQTYSGAKLECLNCHGAHRASATQPLINPDSPLTAWSGTGNAFCLTCHDGGVSPAQPGFPAGVKGASIGMRGIDSCAYSQSPWWVEVSWSNAAHGMGSKRSWRNYVLSPPAPSYELKCGDCHDPHGSYTATNPLGNPYMFRDVVDGTMYVDDGHRGGALVGPNWTYGTAGSVVVPVPAGGPNLAQLCVKCHSKYKTADPFYHSCTSCVTCHGHGAAYGEYDWGGSGATQWCP